MTTDTEKQLSRLARAVRKSIYSDGSSYDCQHDLLGRDCISCQLKYELRRSEEVLNKKS